MKTLGSVAAVVDAIRDEADDARERVQKEQEEELAALAGAPEESVEPPDREERLERARKEARELLIQEDAADRREALAEREGWMREVVARAEGDLAARDPASRRDRLLRLAGEALSALVRGLGDRAARETFEVVVAPRDAPLLDESWRLALLSVAGLPGAPRPEVTASETLDGGCLVRAGRVAFDNSFAARGKRLERVWRAALGELYGGERP